ncbi:putative Carbon catabolite-derepressing protein kinase [Blattamonas nauphoetae]|uniref:non-specific serine/threonine protein kinase n=1 Tax=Blattamonas nauphoetae TaxID=2049346 RepID=A0ABQ9XHN1_9EUKA|nr:putative Carbon catabolite-derepressing protein kinase [Blattamonas nauphoetae]
MAQKGESMIPPGYTLVRPISEGAFGRVLEIKESSTGKSYALKLIPRLTEADQKRAEREVSLLERFRHARIVGLHKSVVMETYHGIVMDLGKRNLKDLMIEYESRKKLIPLEVAVQICIDIAEGLCVMHNHQTHPMAHGDLKPENVLLTEDNRAMLCDLGAADSSGINTSHSAKEIGTFEYNSPERLDDKDQKGTPASDVWSLGVIVHRMVTGRPLFGDESLPRMVRAIMDFDESKISTSIPTAIRGVLVRILEPNPDCRATSTQLFKGRLLERILGVETPLSKMKDGQIRDLEKRLAELTEDYESLRATYTDEYSFHLDKVQLKKITGLPLLLVLPCNSYKIEDRTFTRLRLENKEDALTPDVECMLFIAEPITRGIVSISITLNSLTTLEDQPTFAISLSSTGIFMQSLVDPLSPLAMVGFESEKGELRAGSPSEEDEGTNEPCHQPLKAGDVVVMEVNMETNPRTVQFFVNGKAGKCYASGLTESMSVTLMAFGEGTSFRLNSMMHLTTPTPFAPGMKAVQC